MEMRDLARGLRVIQQFYPEFANTEGAMQVLYQRHRYIPAAIFMKACETLVHESTYRPTPAALQKAVDKEKAKRPKWRAEQMDPAEVKRQFIAMRKRGLVPVKITNNSYNFMKIEECDDIGWTVIEGVKVNHFVPKGDEHRPDYTVAERLINSPGELVSEPPRPTAFDYSEDF